MTLAAVRTEPAAPPMRQGTMRQGAMLQRAVGAARIEVATVDGRTRLKRLRQDGCGKIRLPRDADARDLEAVLINTSGGITGGDRIAWGVRAGPGAGLTVTTQACEKVYRAREDRAEVAVTLIADAGAAIDWLPQETILFDGAALSRTLEADLAPGARLLCVEAVVLGRTAMGETVRRGALRDRWRIRRDGRLAFADDLRFEGPVADLARRPATLAGGAAFASLLLSAPDAEARLPEVRARLGCAGGASAFDGQLFARIVAADGLALRRVLLPVITALRDGAAAPRVWRL